MPAMPASPASPSLSRRVLPALLVALVSTTVLGALVVAADVGSAGEPLPANFGIAQPRVGDAWRYNATLTGDWRLGGQDTLSNTTAKAFGELRWSESGTVRGADGALHDANRLDTRMMEYHPEDLVVDYDSYAGSDGAGGQAQQARASGSQGPTGSAELQHGSYWDLLDGSGWVLAGSDHFARMGTARGGNHTQTFYGVLGVGQSVTHTNYLQGFFEYPADQSPCLALNALQGANVTVAAPLQLFGACDMGASLFSIPAGVSFRAVSVDTLGTVQALRYDASSNGTTYSAWFTPDIAYPVRLSVALPAMPKPDVPADDRSQYTSDVYVPGARAITLDLTGFDAGTKPLDPKDDTPDRNPAPALQLADRKPWGMDETGITHPFPLSEAYEGALNSTSFPDLHTYVAGHPDAYVSAASYAEKNDQSGSHDRIWSVQLDDGSESLRFTATQSSPDPFLPVALRGQVKVPATYQRDGGWAGSVYGTPTRGLSPKAVPARFPTVASLAARWSAFDGSKTPLNSWGWTVECPDGADTCEHAVVMAYAGSVRNDFSFLSRSQTPFAIPGNPYGTEVSAIVLRTVTFDGGGNAVQMVQVDDRQDTASTAQGPPNPLGPSAGTNVGYGVQSSAIKGLPTTSWVPPPAQAAGIGFVGVLLGILYWVWPKMKALAFLGLFSRMERGELLEHPARQRLVQLVEAQPGIHYHDLAKASGLANGTAVHHLRKLTDAGHLNVRRSGRYTCYFPGGRVDAHEAAAAPLLKSHGARQVLQTVRARPGLSGLELAEATGLQPSTVHYHVQRLAEAGLVEGLRQGRHVRFHPGLRPGPAAVAAS